MDTGMMSLLLTYILLSFIGGCYSFDNVMTYLGERQNYPSSYTKYTPWNSVKRGMIVFSFITSNPNGLLLHVGDSNTTEWTRNYLELRIQNGMLNFISKTKNGSNVIKWKRAWYEKEVDDLKWHEVQIKREGINAMIELDKEKKFVQFGVQGIAPISFSGVIYMGGSKSEPLHCGEDSKSIPFVGAVKDMQYGSTVKILHTVSTEFGYQDYCTNKRTRYFMCENGGVCVNKFNDFECNCLGTGFEGRRCETTSTTVHFKGLDYIEWRPSFQQQSFHSNKIALRFKTREPSGVLIYIGNSTKYLTIELYRGHVIVGICVDSVRLTVNSSRRALNDNHWHLVEVTRREMSVKVILNKTVIALKTLPGQHRHSMLDDGEIFVGGKDHLFWLQGSVSKQSFMGCLQQVYYNGGNIFNSIRPTTKFNVRTYGNIVFGCPVKTTKPPFTKVIRSKRYRPTPDKNANVRSRKNDIESRPTPASRKKIDKTSKTILIVGIIVGIVVLIVIIAASVHYLRNRYKKEIILTAVYTKSPKQNDASSATTSVFISPSSSGGETSYKSNNFIR